MWLCPDDRVCLFVFCRSVGLSVRMPAHLIRWLNTPTTLPSTLSPFLSLLRSLLSLSFSLSLSLSLFLSLSPPLPLPLAAGSSQPWAVMATCQARSFITRLPLCSRPMCTGCVSWPLRVCFLRPSIFCQHLHLQLNLTCCVVAIVIVAVALVVDG
jgi:hypothetical protein